MQQSTSPRFIPVADHGVLVEFDGGIETALNKRVARLARTLQRCLPNGVGPVVPTYRSLLIHYDAGVQTQAAVCDWLRGVLADAEPAPLRCRRWRIPVCYGGDYGMDLEAVARYHALSPDDVIALHSGTAYRVFMVGFSPGVAYLGPLSERLHTPRLKTPRVSTPAGSVNIGGEQALIASVPGPSGWHLLGRTPVRSFDPRRDPPFLFDQGDEVCFEPVSSRDFHALESRQSREAWLPEWTWLP